MTSLFSTTQSLVLRCGALASVALAFALFGDACTSGGAEGDQCNALILHPEEGCDEGLVCKPFTCARAYCCPNGRASTDPNCNGEGCPDEDAGGGEGEEAGSEAGDQADAAPDSPAIDDGGDGG